MSELADLSSLIQELMKHKISSISSSSKMLEIVRLPLSLYRQAQKIFKNEAQVRKIMQQQLQKHFYVKIVDEEKQSYEFKQISSLVRQVYEASDKIPFYLMQLNLRLLLLGLSVSFDEKNIQKSRQGIKKLIKNLQIDIVINSQLTFSETVIKQFEQYLQDFPQLTFLQQALLLFEKCNTFHITQWIQNKIEQRRQAFEVKMKEEQALVVNNDSKHQIKSIRRKNTIKRDENINSNETEDKSILNSEIREASVKQIIANSRKSGTLDNSVGKINKFIFRSSKKASIEIPQSTQKKDIKKSISKQKKIEETKVSRFTVQTIHQDEQTEESRVLCHGTPPQKNKKPK